VKKLLFFIVILLFARGATFFDANAEGKPMQYENLLLGYELGANGNLNQVLAVLVGPQGKAGAAGVAGKNGFVGINGAAGQDGIDGAPGPVGPSGAPGVAGLPGRDGVIGRDGAPGAAGAPGRSGAPGPAGPAGSSSGGGGAIAMISLPSGDSNCPTGGTKFIASDASVSYACNGSKGDVAFSAGVGSISVCDDAIDIGMISHLDPTLGRFILDGIRVSNMDSDCEGDRLDITLSTTAAGGVPLPFVCTVLSLPDPLGGDLYLTRAGYNLKYGESGLVVPLFCDPSLSTMDLTILDSILGFQLS
jgi:hypothetical protein